ncbi:MAG: hypothetical protein IJW28_05590, partial [Clostridia bacterium]|nr:hypothetical protein [Clostridia bacterium]
MGRYYRRRYRRRYRKNDSSIIVGFIYFLLLPFFLLYLCIKGIFMIVISLIENNKYKPKKQIQNSIENEETRQ